MNNKQPTIVSRRKKSYRPVHTAMSQDGNKKVTKMNWGCCMGGKIKK